MSPTVSVVTTCYNASKYLKGAIESILEQTFQDFEYILVDDGSTDNTLEIIRHYQENDPRIVVIEKTNTGVTDSANAGIGIAKGTWIARLDSDDLALKDRIEKQVNYLLEHKKVVLLGTGCYVIDETGRIIKKKKYPSGHARLLANLENDGITFPQSSVIFRRDEEQKIGGYRKRFIMAEDRDLYLRLSTTGQVACLEEPLIKLRKHTESLTAGNYEILILAYASMISYKLKMQNLPDPIEQEDAYFRGFLEWLEGSLKQQGYSRGASLYFDIERRRYAKRGIKNKIWILNLLNSRAGYQLIKQRIFGSDLATRLAKEWISFHER